jgi:hypothetical protein
MCNRKVAYVSKMIRLQKVQRISDHKNLYVTSVTSMEKAYIIISQED